MDVVKTIGAVTRAVIACEYAGGPARAVCASRDFPTDIEDVWDALTNAERIPRWFLPISGELRLGGRFQLQGNAGGAITVCEPPRRLEVDWECAGLSWVKVRLEERGPEMTRLMLEHICPLGEHWDQFGPGATGVGWDGALVGLERHLAGLPPVAPEEARAWMTSEQGKRFYRASSEGWYAADVAAGTEVETARAAAARTAAAYTGE